MKQLSAIPLFYGLPPEHVEDLSMIVVDQVCQRGQVIFSEGEEGSGFYVVISGRVKIFKLSVEGKEQILHMLGPGEPFGEAAVFAGRNFPANAEALEASRIFYFPRDAFVALVKQNPSLALNMLAILSQRLRRFAALVEDLSLKEVPGRLAAYLLYLSEKQKNTTKVGLDTSKGQLASLLGTIPETLSRVLARMGNEGIIELEGPNRVRILDRESLEKLGCGEMRLPKSESF
jgi:CRP/FNR family transcriptional regulator